MIKKILLIMCMLSLSLMAETFVNKLNGQLFVGSSILLWESGDYSTNIRPFYLLCFTNINGVKYRVNARYGYENYEKHGWDIIDEINIRLIEEDLEDRAKTKPIIWYYSDSNMAPLTNKYSDYYIYQPNITFLFKPSISEEHRPETLDVINYIDNNEKEKYPDLYTNGYQLSVFSMESFYLRMTNETVIKHFEEAMSDIVKTNEIFKN